MRRILIATLLTATIAACGGSDSSADSADTTDDDLAIQEPGAAAEEVDGEADLEPTAPEGVVDFGEFSQEHVGTNVDYEQTPPVGGPHLPVWQTCDFYDTPVPNERGVHSLEHGAVWITFDPELTADEVSIIESFADGEATTFGITDEGLVDFAAEPAFTFPGVLPVRVPGGMADSGRLYSPPEFVGRPASPFDAAIADPLLDVRYGEELLPVFDGSTGEELIEESSCIRSGQIDEMVPVGPVAAGKGVHSTPDIRPCHWPGAPCRPPPLPRPPTERAAPGVAVWNHRPRRAL